MKLKGVLVKEVQANYEMSGSEAETIAKLIERGYVVILKKKLLVGGKRG